MKGYHAGRTSSPYDYGEVIEIRSPDERHMAFIWLPDTPAEQAQVKADAQLIVDALNAHQRQPDPSKEEKASVDQLASALNAIRDAARVWSGVDSSDLRVAFGGLASLGTPQNIPGADIVFDEMDPLTLGLTATNAAQNTPTSGPGGSFVPIRRPQVRLNRNFSNWTSPSFTEAPFWSVSAKSGARSPTFNDSFRAEKNIPPPKSKTTAAPAPIISGAWGD